MQYAGLCVGGPFDGQRIVQPAPRFRAEERPARPARPLYQKHIPAEQVTVNTTDYVHHDVGDIGLWVPSHRTLGDAIKALAVAYIAASR